MTQAHIQCQQQLHEILQSLKPLFKNGISEYELITLLKLPPYEIFDTHALSDTLVLFQTHFILFHSLYKLRDDWRRKEIGELEICATNIKLKPYLANTEKSLETIDPLGEYYLNWQNLHDTNEEELNSLLDDFWHKMLKPNIRANHSSHDIAEAIDVLGLSEYRIDELSFDQVKAQYRKLQHSYHPDKGGCLESTQRITKAYKILSDSLKGRA